MELYLGIDTSCYTTSLALIDSEGNLFSQARKLLSVPAGGRGLAQNEAIFQHVTNLPVLMEELLPKSISLRPAGVVSSVRPRPVEGSYMPVFRVAESYGRSIATMFGVPFLETTHQEGHIAAGIWSAGGPNEQEFLAVHLSGGTSEILKVKRNSPSSDNQYSIELLGGSTDLHAGQLIDRVGVALGMPFPAGPHLEKMAMEANGAFSIPSSVKEFSISFSGPETAAMRLIENGIPAQEVARAVEKCITNSLLKVLNKAALSTGLKSALVVGGVAANRFIRQKLISKLEPGIKLYFAEPSLSSDNAVGVAAIGMYVLTGKSTVV